MSVAGIRGKACASLALALWCSVCTGAARWSQLATPVFQHVVADHGPPNLSTTLAVDGDGFLWVGSFAGLARWDGYRLRTYAPKADDRNALPDNIVQALHADQAGRLWIGTNAHGLVRYERAGDRFLPIPDGLAHVSVLAIANDGQGGLWVGTDAGLDQLDLDAGSGAVKRIRHDSASRALPDPHVRAILPGRDGTLWLGTDKGLFRRAAGVPLHRVALPLDVQPEVGSLLEDSAGRLWIGTRGHGAFVLPAGAAQASAVREPTLAAESVYAIAEARPGQLWLGTFGQGIVAVDAASGQARRMRHDPAVPSSLVHDSVWAVLRDRAGLVWAATGRGLSWHDPQQDAVLTAFGATVPGSASISDADVFSVLPMADGRLWLGLGNNGIDIIDPAGGRAGQLRPNAALPERALPRDRIVSMAAAANGMVVLATPRGAYQVSSRNGNAVRLPLPAPGPAIRINAVAVAGGQVWVGSRDNGLWRQSPDGALRRIGMDGPQALGDQRISVIAAASNGKLWIGTRNGLDLLDPATLAVQHIALPSTYVTSLLTDRRGRLWVGTYGGGLVVLADGKARRVPGLPSDNISTLLADREGHVWASTDNGVARIASDTLAVRALHRADGIAITNDWIGAGAVSDQGELLFGGLGGLTIIRPGQLRHWDYRPPVVLTDVRIGGKPVPAGRFNAGNPLAIGPDANSLSVEFAALDFSAPERNRYAYRLDGYERDWNDTDASRRLATYTNLPPGQYTLQLRGSNRNGAWSGQVLSVPVNVLPAWYQSSWWRAMVVLLVLALMVAIVRLRTAHLRHNKRQLEAEVDRQTAALRSQQAELVQANRALALSNDTMRQLGDVGRDITANLDAEAVFKALHRHVAGLLDAAQMSIYRYDRTNRQLELAYGGARGEAAQLQVALDDPASLVALAARDRREVSVQSGGAMRSAEYAPLVANDRLLGVMVVESNKEHAYGERERLIFGTLCAYGAIAIINAQARLTMVQQEKLASLGGLVAGMAHGVNTPLGTVVSAISGASEALQELADAVDSGKVNKSLLTRTMANATEFAGLALRNATRAADLIDSFKAMVTQRDTEHADTIDLALYLPQVATLVHRHLEQQGHRVLIEVPAPLKVHTIPDALNEVMTRVLANVADHAFEGGRYGVLRISARRLDDGKTEIVVADDGHGIAAHDVGRVFDPFFTTRSGSGNHVGLGLNVAFNHVTERLKGTITVDSTHGAGTTVTIRF